RNKRAIVIAEESTAWPGVTKPAEDEGLGFTFKWNMGWMHDFLEYMKLDPYFRKYNHNKMTFGMLYAYSEKFILVLSHDEVVHLKCSMLGKMPGAYQDKFANLKVAYTFFMGHPGKKLLFMGQDFAQWSEWSEARSLDWHLLDEPEHREVWEYFKALLHIYRKYPACYELDQYPEGFRWINPNDGDRSIFSFIRRAADGKDNLLFVCNFTPVERPDYMVGVPQGGNYTLVLDSEMKGSATYRAVHIESDGQPYALKFPLPAYGTAVFRFSDTKKKPSNKNKSSQNVHRK
ncbi:MAG: alpha amylase C-terminal domain-containing protein, partial [Lachnospiraceae bacterium]